MAGTQAFKDRFVAFDAVQAALGTETITATIDRYLARAGCETADRTLRDYSRTLTLLSGENYRLGWFRGGGR